MTTSRSRSSRSEALGTRIRLARARRGLTKAALARATGFSVRQIDEYEAQGAPAAHVERLAAELHVPEPYLTREGVDPILTSEARFRSLSRATERQRSAACAAGTSGIELYEWLADRFRLPSVVLPDLDGEAPERAADAVRAAWEQGRGALPNLTQLAEANGVRVVSLPPIAHTVDAYSLWREDRPYVFLSTMKSVERTRFDLAHEIGHLVLHSRGHRGDLEREADEFAAAFLMPAELLLARVGKEPAVPAVLRLRSDYGVAATAMLRRLHDLGVLSDEVYRQDCVVLAQRGFRSGEPGGLRPERSRVFEQTLGLLRSSGASIDVIASEVGLSLQDLHDLTFGHTVLSLAGGSATRTARQGTLRVV